MSDGFVIDATEIIGFASTMSAAPHALQREMTVANTDILTEGIRLARGNAPVDEGFLRESIAVIDPATAIGGSFGTSAVYAWMREVGGTIYGNPWLVFQTKSGQWVKVRSVTQTGTRYMGRAVDSLRPHAQQRWQTAVTRALAGIANR